MKENFHSIQCENFVKENCRGSLSAFIAAFTSRQKLSDQELEKILQMIGDYGRVEERTVELFPTPVPTEALSVPDEEKG